MALQQARRLPDKGNQKKRGCVLFEMPDNFAWTPSNSSFSPRRDGVPHAYESVQASGDQQAVLSAKVERLDAFMDSEDPLVARRPELWSPAQLDFLGLSFVDGLSDLSQLLLSVC